MATAKKLKSGKYRCLVFDHTDESGKRHYKSFTSTTKKEAEYLASSFKINSEVKISKSTLTMYEALIKYCEMKSNILSPSTLVNYRRLINTAYDDLLRYQLDKIEDRLIQAWVNSYAIGRSPKTVRNAYALLYITLKTFIPNLRLNITLPQKVKPKLYVPTDSDIQALITYFKDNDIDMLLAVYLASFGTLRRSEICALTVDDIESNIIHINKALVYSGNNAWTLKTTKTTSSTRNVDMPEYVLKLFPSKGRIVNLNPNQITHRFKRALDKLEIPNFRFHDLRHYAASMMHALGIPDVYIMQRGGWSSDNTLKNIYRNVMDDYKEKFTNRVFEHLESMR